MFLIHTLRMLADLSVYFFMAELFVITLGGASQLVPMLLLSVSYGLLVCLQNRNFNKAYLLLPVMVLFLPFSYTVALLPPVVYIIYLIIKEQTTLSWDRQSEMFSICIKIFPVASIVLCLLGYTATVMQYCLPMAFLSLVTSVFLMRMLRQPPAVYLNPQFQRKNSMVFVAVILLAALFSREFVFNAIGSFFSFIYMKCVYPILSLFIYLFLLLLNLIINIFSWLRFGEVNFEENHLAGAEMGPTFKDAVIAGDHFATTDFILSAIAVIVLLVGAYFFFRWLALHKGEESFFSQGIDIIRGNDSKKQKKERATTTVLQVRRQYRLFLKLYKEHGGKIETSFTSQDVLNQSVKILSETPADVFEEMREIYLKARYGGTATKADLKRIKQINKELSK